MKHKTGVADAYPLIAIHAHGKRCPGLLLEISSTSACVQMVEPQALVPGILVSLSIAELPTFPGDVVSIGGDALTVEFRWPLHPTVLDYIGEETTGTVNRTAATGVTPNTKRATNRPPFPFDN